MNAGMKEALKNMPETVVGRFLVLEDVHDLLPDEPAPALSVRFKAALRALHPQATVCPFCGDEDGFISHEVDCPLANVEVVKPETSAPSPLPPPAHPAAGSTAGS